MRDRDAAARQDVMMMLMMMMMLLLMMLLLLAMRSGRERDGCFAVVVLEPGRGLQTAPLTCGRACVVGWDE